MKIENTAGIKISREVREFVALVAAGLIVFGGHEIYNWLAAELDSRPANLHVIFDDNTPAAGVRVYNTFGSYKIANGDGVVEQAPAEWHQMGTTLRVTNGVWTVPVVVGQHGVLRVDRRTVFGAAEPARL